MTEIICYKKDLTFIDLIESYSAKVSIGDASFYILFGRVFKIADKFVYQLSENDLPEQVLEILQINK